LELAEALIVHSDEALGEYEDDDCLTLDGVIRDCGLKIRRMAMELMAEQAGPAAKVANTAN